MNIRSLSLVGVVTLCLFACSDSNAPEVVTSYTLRYYQDLDLDAGVDSNCATFNIFCNPDDDIYLAYNSQATPPAVVFQNQGRNEAIAQLMGRSFASVHLADTAGAGFTTQLIADPFDNTRVILVRTAAGNVYKLGDPVGFGQQDVDSVRFNTARLN